MESLKKIAFISLAHLSKLLTGILLIKIIAIYLGPAGLGQLGNLMNLASLLAVIAGGGISSAMIKYVAEYNNQPYKLLSFLNTAVFYSTSISIFIFITLCLFSSQIAQYIFSNSDYFWIIILIGAFQIICAITNLILGVANGLRESSIYLSIQLGGNLLALPFLWYFVKNFDLSGAAIAIAISTYNLANIIPALYFYRKSIFYKKINIFKFKNHNFKKLSRFTLMLIFSSITFPLTEIIIRQKIISNLDLTHAGYWQGLIKLSSAYLGVFSVILSLYFIPIISATDDKKTVMKLTLKALAMICLVFSISGSILYIFRDFAITTLLSDDFIALRDLMYYQIIGDFFKIASYVIGFVAVAKAATKTYIAAEILQNFLFLSLALSLLPLFLSIEGITVAYSITYFLYFMICAVAFTYYIYSGENSAFCGK